MSRRRRRVIVALLAALLVAAATFLANGLATPTAEMRALSPPPTPWTGERLTVMAFNLAKAGFHRGGLSFREADEVRRHLDEVAALIRREGVDVAFLSEVVWEAGPCPVNQVEHLAAATGLTHLAFGENYSFGWPWYRVRTGNAVISRVPLGSARVQQLAGPRSPFDPTGARNALWVELLLSDGPVPAASVRNDSFDLANNARQVRQLIDALPGREALLAGDFNAEPDTRPMRLLDETGRFTRAPSPPTFPSGAPARTIDHVFAPHSWTLVDSSVPACELSDHRPVIATFRLP